ncbi:DUF559 domain-containing protein [Mycolicibacterium mengxianglii]|uniref:DUF559 domain-containing protein n=1 Tax=Mycolicibacterium mengxianglii TaxID=2736649 RepID=UPI0027D9D276|nr:DUF559 domain-containing protein [Mycolicibacterium mengxianglii]
MRLPLPGLATDRVLGIQGPTAEQFAVAIDPLPDDVPVMVGCDLPCEVIEARADPVAVVEVLLSVLEDVARAQLQAWLPAADTMTGTSDLERRTIRRLARETASEQPHFGPFLADLAEAALMGRPVAARWDPETRAGSLAGLLRSCYHRNAVVLVLRTARPLGAHAQRAVGTAAQWLADRGQVGVWVLGVGVVEPDRFPIVALPVPAGLDVLARDHVPAVPAVSFPVLAGRPHPGSAVEVNFEAALARCHWARGRTWNRTYQQHPLAPPMRVDLMWPHELVVVELDGPDHRGALKYADDRRRDNALTLAGYAVLRFTNDEVLDDLSLVLAMIERVLTARRHDERNPG